MPLTLIPPSLSPHVFLLQFVFIHLVIYLFI